MSMTMHSKLLGVAVLLIAAPFYTALADPINSSTPIVLFGDSLSDVGNASIASGGLFPGNNYAPDEYTDGTNTTPATSGPLGLWIDQFAHMSGLNDPAPFLSGAPGSTNFAVASAQTGTSNPQDMGFQVAAFAPPGTKSVPSNALYIFWGGANDIYNGNSGTTAATNIAGYIQGLSALGAKYFLWLNVPQLGSTPLGASNAAFLDAQSTDFDTAWALD